MFSSWWEWLVVLLVVVLLFGAKRLPELGSGLGKAISNFRNSCNCKAEEKKESEESEKQA